MGREARWREDLPFVNHSCHHRPRSLVFVRIHEPIVMPVSEPEHPEIPLMTAKEVRVAATSAVERKRIFMAGARSGA